MVESSTYKQLVMMRGNAKHFLQSDSAPYPVLEERKSHCKTYIYSENGQFF
jgi:hypothetical protein